MTTVLDKTGSTEPDAELFKTRFTEFVPVADAKIAFVLVECTDHVDNRWRASDYQMAIMYLTAHLLSMEGEPEASIAAAAAAGAAAPAAGASGTAKSVQVGDAKVEFAEDVTKTNLASKSGGTGMDDDRLNFNSTHYGQMFIRLRSKNFSGPRVVAGQW